MNLYACFSSYLLILQIHRYFCLWIGLVSRNFWKIIFCYLDVLLWKRIPLWNGNGTCLYLSFWWEFPEENSFCFQFRQSCSSSRKYFLHKVRDKGLSEIANHSHLPEGVFERGSLPTWCEVCHLSFLNSNTRVSSPDLLAALCFLNMGNDRRRFSSLQNFIQKLILKSIPGQLPALHCDAIGH